MFPAGPAAGSGRLEAESLGHYMIIVVVMVILIISKVVAIMIAVVIIVILNILTMIIRARWVVVTFVYKFKHK